MDTEGHSADRAMVSFLSILSMSPHMSGQFTRLSTGISAELAFVRFLACVRPQMDNQVASVCEYLHAVVASVFLRFRVSSGSGFGEFMFIDDNDLVVFFVLIRSDRSSVLASEGGDVQSTTTPSRVRQ